ncbi:MAG TPA: tetratricopeptide repeat protein, partial [Nitrospirota bacterium]|nr:tetratricopeptide repeat protein [Nitrospirota bacterium]
MKWKILFLIAVVSTAVYSNSFNNSFHFDDQHFIVENTYIRDIKNIPSFFFSPDYLSFEKVFTSHYRPLLITSYAINYALGGLRPEGYHAVNLLFHIGSAFLVYLILQAMLLSVRHTELVSGSIVKEIPKQVRDDREALSSSETNKSRAPIWLPIAASLIFAVHPFNSEVVNYITARSSVMCAFFYLLSFYFWLRFRNASLLTAAGMFPCYIASVFAFILAMLTKETAITLPLILFLYDVYFYKHIIHARKLHSSSYLKSVASGLSYIPFVFLVIAPYLIYRISVYGSILGGGTRNYLSNLLTQPKVLLNYVQLMFLPAGLTIDHDLRLSSTVLDATVILSFASILIILFAAYLLFRLGREWRVLSFFILWFFITLLPTTIIPLNAVLQENRGYLAGIAAAVVAGVVLCRLKSRLIFPGLALLVIVLSILTVNRNFAWKDDLSLWSDAVAKSPMSARAHDNLGLAWIGVKKYDLAIDEFDKTLELNPEYYLAYYNSGVAYHLQGDLERAKVAYENSLKINPAYFRSYYNVGIVYKSLGELDMAVSSYDKAISIDPRHPFVYNNLG